MRDTGMPTRPRIAVHSMAGLGFNAARKSLLRMRMLTKGGLSCIHSARRYSICGCPSRRSPFSVRCGRRGGTTKRERALARAARVDTLRSQNLANRARAKQYRTRNEPRVTTFIRHAHRPSPLLRGRIHSPLGLCIGAFPAPGGAIRSTGASERSGFPWRDARSSPRCDRWHGPSRCRLQGARARATRAHAVSSGVFGGCAMQGVDVR